MITLAPLALREREQRRREREGKGGRKRRDMKRVVERGKQWDIKGGRARARGSV